MRGRMLMPTGGCLRACIQVPIFTDKHLAVTWDDASWIYRTGKELGLVHMAGSSVPLYHRDPWLEHPLNCDIEAALVLTYGDLEACEVTYAASPHAWHTLARAPADHAPPSFLTHRRRLPRAGSSAVHDRAA
jgi:hypothetical protein